MSEEQQKWRQMVLDLQEVMTIAQIAESLDVAPRQVWRWKEGDRPKGMTAVRLYLLHVKRCPRGHVTPETDCGAEGKA